MNGEHLSHDAPLLNEELLTLRKQLDELFAESDRQVARILFRIMQDD